MKHSPHILRHSRKRGLHAPTEAPRWHAAQTCRVLVAATKLSAIALVGGWTVTSCGSSTPTAFDCGGTYAGLCGKSCSDMAPCDVGLHCSNGTCAAECSPIDGCAAGQSVQLDRHLWPSHRRCERHPVRGDLARVSYRVRLLFGDLSGCSANAALPRGHHVLGLRVVQSKQPLRRWQYGHFGQQRRRVRHRLRLPRLFSPGRAASGGFFLDVDVTGSYQMPSWTRGSELRSRSRSAVRPHESVDRREQGFEGFHGRTHQHRTGAGIAFFPAASG